MQELREGSRVSEKPVERAEGLCQVPGVEWADDADGIESSWLRGYFGKPGSI